MAVKGTTTTTTVNGYLRLRRVAGCMNSNNKKLIGCSFIGAFIYAFIRYSLRFVSFRVVSAVFAIYMANNIRKCLLIDSPVFSSTCDRANTHTHTHRGHRLQLQLHLRFPLLLWPVCMCPSALTPQLRAGKWIVKHRGACDIR